MENLARDTYLETEVATATPQRLRLMLIDSALRRARQAQTALASGHHEEASTAVVRCREIVGELIAGIQPDKGPVARTVLGLHVFLLSTLAEIGQTRDGQQLVGVIRVLEEERQTWQDVCRLVPDRIAEPAAEAPVEELAPQRVPLPLDAPSAAGAEAFSIEA